MRLEFEKMQATGNDFIVVAEGKFPDHDGVELLARKYCRRHFGIGADGLLVVGKSSKADIKMDMYNPDGTMATCGNGLRCAAVFASEHGMISADEFKIETRGRIRQVHRVGDNFSINMGEPFLDASDIPVSGIKGQVVKQPMKFGDEEYEVTCASLGNPHAVIFVDNLNYHDIQQIGPVVENSRNYFPERTNLMLVQVKNRTEIELKIWERGAGATLSCGTGGVAAVVASVLCDYTDREVTVTVPGGVLQIEYPKKGGCTMSGPAKKVFDGWIEI